MTDKYAIKILHDCLKDRSKWFIDFSCSDDYLIEIVEKAKEDADSQLSKMSLHALYQRYRAWKDSEPYIAPDEHLFYVFLSQVCFDLGKSSLKGEEKIMFEDECSLTFKFV